MPEAAPSYIAVKVKGKKDAGKIFDYVYSSLRDMDMSSKAHVLSHLINDGIMEKVPKYVHARREGRGELPLTVILSLSGAVAAEHDRHAALAVGRQHRSPVKRSRSR